MIGGAGNVTRFFVDRLRLAAVPLRSARVEQAPVRRAEQAGDLLRVAHEVAARRRPELVLPAGFDPALRRPTFSQPAREAAVEYGDGIVTEPSAQPPQPAGEHAVVLVVGDDLHATPAAVGDAEPAERLR